jgi:membrane dipeptidase
MRQINRRTVLTGLVAGAIAGPQAAIAQDPARLPIGDMHAHLFFVGKKSASIQPLAPSMASGGVSLMSWSLVGDMPWLRRGEKGLRQAGAPKPGGATQWFDAELRRVKAHLAEQKIGVVLSPADLDKALAGEPHVVLSVEGASFLDEGIQGLKHAYDAGIRHLQLVHYVNNAIGDFQTESPRHGGLTPFGREVVRECNRLGILVDLAHSTAESVQHALDLSRAPMVWSHSSVARSGKPHWQLPVWRARQLAREEARAIAAKGGVVGLWALRSDVGPTVETYGDRLIEMANWLGDDHVAFGTDMNAVSNSPIETYADLRQALVHMQRRGLDQSRLHKIAIGNYVRVLRQAMQAAQA